MFTFPTCWRQRICVLFSQKNSCDQSKYFLNIEACLSKERMLFHRTFCILGNWLSFQNPQTLVKEPSLHHEKEHHKVIRWILLLNFLYGWDFPSLHKVHTDQGKPPFEAVMCTVGAASQISCMLTEDICFWYKISLESPQEFNQTSFLFE